MLRWLPVLAFVILASADDEVTCDYNGSKMKNDEVITAENAFRVKCVTENDGSWKTEIVGCVSPSGKEVNPGDKLEEGDKAYECIKNEGGQIMLKESRGSKADCQDGHKFGEEWKEKSFKFKCVEGGISKFVACVSKDGTEVEVGNTKEVAGFDMKCEQFPNGTISFATAKDPKEYECKAKDGSMKKNGEEYKEGNFVRKCEDFGMGKIVGCTAEGVSDTIPVNKNVTVGEKTYSCVKDGDKFSFRVFGKQEA